MVSVVSANVLHCQRTVVEVGGCRSRGWSITQMHDWLDDHGIEPRLFRLNTRSFEFEFEEDACACICGGIRFGTGATRTDLSRHWTRLIASMHTLGYRVSARTHLSRRAPPTCANNFKIMSRARP